MICPCHVMINRDGAGAPKQAGCGSRILQQACCSQHAPVCGLPANPGAEPPDVDDDDDVYGFEEDSDSTENGDGGGLDGVMPGDADHDSEGERGNATPVSGDATPVPRGDATPAPSGSESSDSTSSGEVTPGSGRASADGVDDGAENEEEAEAEVKLDGRRRVGETWPPSSRTSPRKIARIKRRGMHVGWGAVCCCHVDVAEVEAGLRIVCKRQLIDLRDEGRLQIMEWLIEGGNILDDDPESRTKHVKGINPRDLPVQPEEELEAMGLAMWP